MKPDTEAVIVSFFAELVSEKTDEISTLYDEIKKINRVYFQKDIPKRTENRLSLLRNVIEKKQNEVRKFLFLLNRIQDDSISSR